MHALFLNAILAAAGATLPSGDWSFVGAILTFAIPVGLFIIVGTWLYFEFTRPHAVPGHRDLVPAMAGGAAGMGRHAAGGPRHAAPPASSPPAAGTQPPDGGTPPAGGQHAADGTEDGG